MGFMPEFNRKLAALSQRPLNLSGGFLEFPLWFQQTSRFAAAPVKAVAERRAAAAYPPA